ncbi:hypothetical protein GUJ93_ZPchr0006g41817 [Zizania palustris]|uniref:Uncharacterized protein n=1 Tax=Zizania palustris TaxID=103762 RepID=A0A8J5SRD0_ZIZPA|nr:hypothetical protein GUJ93_ZPchr0006g41817 [Zizania palustris]
MSLGVSHLVWSPPTRRAVPFIFSISDVPQQPARSTAASAAGWLSAHRTRTAAKDAAPTEVNKGIGASAARNSPAQCERGSAGLRFGLMLILTLTAIQKDSCKRRKRKKKDTVTSLFLHGQVSQHLLRWRTFYDVVAFLARVCVFMRM